MEQYTPESKTCRITELGEWAASCRAPAAPGGRQTQFELAQLELLNIVPCMQPHTDMDHLNGQNYTAHSVRFSEMEQNSQKISAHEQLS